MIFIGLGANLDSEAHGPPMRTLSAALAEMETPECSVRRRSSWYRSAPVPASAQPWFINGVAELECDLSPESLLTHLHAVEEQFGRVRSVPNAARAIDLDLLVYHDLVRPHGPSPLVPHPRMQDRAFVLLPLRDLAPGWVDPRDGRTLPDLIAALPKDQTCELAEDDNFDRC